MLEGSTDFGLTRGSYFFRLVLSTKFLLQINHQHSEVAFLSAVT